MELQKYLAKPEETIKEHVDKMLEELDRMWKYGYIQDKELYELIRIACIHHDDGKVNPEMQKRLEAARKGKKYRFNPDREIPHNVLSGFFLDRREFDYFTDPDTAYYRVLFAIMYHHDYGDPMEYIIEDSDKIEELLDGFDTFVIKRKTRNAVREMSEDEVAVKVKGFLHICDYSASGGYCSEYPNDFLDGCMENIKKKWREQKPDADWNELQKFCREKSGENIIAVAQTGMGKTEAGFRWIGNNKGYFVLPLRTAINAIYDRVRKDILLNEKIDTRLSILHSESLEYYTGQFTGDTDLLEYESRGKHLSMPLSISTLDQLFDFVMRYQTYEFKLATLSFSRIVIDEIQMYDPELLRYLITGLKYITEMGGKVAVMTATLPPFIKDLLIQSVPFKTENIAVFTDDSLRHHVEVRDRKINAEEIGEFYIRSNRDRISSKILVVCNTIRKAQKIYGELREQLGETENIHILHSRFIRKDRAQLEHEILNFGRTYDENGQIDCQSGIWISTSLVEASLDIDFDYLFTELLDLNSLFQRMGRCNRKGKKPTGQPNCIVYTRIDAEHLTGTTHGFIDRTLFELSREALKDGDGLITESRKIELLNKYFTTEQVRSSDYYQKYESASWIEGIKPYQFQKNDVCMRNILSETVIPSPVYMQNQQEIDALAEAVRDSSVCYMDRVKTREKLMQYTLSVPYWYWIAYKKALVKKKAVMFEPVCLGRHETLPVIESSYDEAGFHQMDFENATAAGEFL